MLRISGGVSRLPFTRPAAVAISLAAAVLISGCDRVGNGAASQTARPSGKELFVEHCASCHGIEGRGDGPLASELRSAPSNLRLLAKNNGGKFPDRRVQRSIDGRGMPPAHGLPEMPVWGAVWRREGMSEGKVGALRISIISHLRSIQE